MTIREIDNRIINLRIELNTIHEALNKIFYRAGSRKLTDNEIREQLVLEESKTKKENQIKRLDFERKKLEFEKVYGYSIDEALSGSASRKNTSNNKAPESASSTNSNDNSNGKGFKVALISTLAIIAALLAFIAFNTSKNKGSGALPTNSPSPTATATATANPTDAFKVLSKSEILERAQYIYDNELTADLKAYTTVEELADLIAVGLSELPIYETGNLRGSASDAIEDSIKVYGGGIAEKELPKVYYSSRALDDSVSDLFATKYDEVYNNIAVGRNTNNPEMVISNIDKLGTMLYYDFIFTNLYSNNIDNIPSELKALALGAAIERWPIYVDSYLASNDLTRCVNVCINQDTKEVGSYNVQDIFQAVLNGRSDNHKVSLSSTSEGNVEGGLMVGYFNDLVAELEYKDEHGLKLR